MGEIPFFRMMEFIFVFVDELQVAASSSEVLAHNLKKLSIVARPFVPTSCARMTRWFCGS